MLALVNLRYKYQWFYRKEVLAANEPPFWMLDMLLLIMEDIITVVLTVNYRPEYTVRLSIPSMIASSIGIYHRVIGIEKLIQGYFIVPLIINLVKALIYIFVATITWHSLLNLKMDQNF
jgi:hypothetical protein